MAATSLQVGMKVTKNKGVGKGELGVVKECKGGKVKVEKMDGAAFVLQSASNFTAVISTSVSDESARNCTAKDNDTLGSPPEDSASSASIASLRTAQHSITVCCWNTLKLGFMHPSHSQAEHLHQLVEMLVHEWKVDVVMLSEVSKNVGLQRVYILCDLMNVALGASDFSLVVSELSGVGEAQNQQEYHVAILRAPIQLEDQMTHHIYTDSLFQSRRLDHAPFTVFLRDNRFSDKACRSFAVTSVHMPPKNRKKDLLVQAKGFLESYMYQRRWPDTVKKGRPFSFAGSNRDFTTHIIGGDFNCCPLLDLDLSRASWWTAFDDAVHTSSGGQAYDNFVVNAGAVEHAWLDICKNLAGLQLSKHGKNGFSDHDIVMLKLVERVKHVIVD